MSGQPATPAPAFPDHAITARVDRVRELMTVDAMLVTDITNIRWLTGFSGSNAWVIIDANRLIFGTDGRYRERAEAELRTVGVDADIVVGFSQPQQLEQLVVAARSVQGSLGAESRHLTHAKWQELSRDLALVAADGHVERARRVKDAGEIARIAWAAELASAALHDVAPLLAAEPTETDVRRELEYRMRLHGADGPSYDTIVASGPDHAARPHHGATARRIVEGDLVVIDVGALVDGYHSDMTRTFVVGDPTDEQLDTYDLVRRSQLEGLSVIGPDVSARDVDAACRGVFVDAGRAEMFLHGTGHGVGLLIHEDPFMATTSTATLVAGDVVTVEPGLYRVGFGGVRIEDLVVVTEDGHRNLTDFRKDTPCPSPPTT